MFIILLLGKTLLNPDGSHTMPEKNISVSQDQSVLTLTSCISLPNDTKFVTNIEVLGYTGDKTSGRLIYGPVALGTLQASPKAEMVHKFNLEKANVTLTSKLTKNLTTNQFEVKSIFRIGLTSSTLYYHSPVIRKLLSYHLTVKRIFKMRNYSPYFTQMQVRFCFVYLRSLFNKFSVR